MQSSQKPGLVPEEVPEGPVDTQQRVEESESFFQPAAESSKGGSWEGELFRPVHRPKVPLLVVLDDGRSDRGEVFRLRQSKFVIGRNNVDVNVPHDNLISKQHAELVRSGSHVDAFWQLRDLGSANKTFVRCREIVLDPGVVVLLGSSFFRFRLFDGAVLQDGSDDRTMLAMKLPDRDKMCPVLVCQAEGGREREFPLSKKKMTLGRHGFGNDIELEDSLLAERHAEISQSKDGSWRIKPMPSRNGIWASVNEIRLGRRCCFRCGEQEFLFVGP